MSRRTDRVADLIRQALSSILSRELADPRAQGASVSSVQVTQDLSVARISVSLLGDDEDDRQQGIEALRRAKGFLRSRLADRLDLRRTPELRFELDRGAEHSQRISDLLEELQDEHEPT